MRRFLIIAIWEFAHHFKSRRFLLSTFIAPIILSAIVIVPSWYYESSQATQDQVIGCVEFDTSNYCQALSERLALSLDHRTSSKVLLQPVLPDTTAKLREDFIQFAVAKHTLDSLENAYNTVKERRRYLFQLPPSGKKEQQLGDSYEEMIATRERRDLAEITYHKMYLSADSLVKISVLKKADSLLHLGRIAGYVVIDGEKFNTGVVEFHSKQPMNFLRIQPLQQALQVMLVEERMRADGITVTKMQEFLEPVEIEELLVEGSHKREFKFMATYLAPVVVMLFFFIAVFMSTGFLFSSIVQEKNNRVLEILISSANSFQLVGGKIFGIGLLGILQILIWMLITAFLMFLNLVPTHDITFLTPENAGIFLLYFILSYLLFGILFVGIGATAASGMSAHQFALLLRVLLVSPVMFTVFVLLSPNALFIRFLSYIPFLAPAFMILRTPLGEPPLVDYYISAGGMGVSILICLFFTAKIFRLASLIYQRHYSYRSIFDLLKTK